jgi:hypothetical protein
VHSNYKITFFFLGSRPRVKREGFGLKLSIFTEMPLFCVVVCVLERTSVGEVVEGER